MNTKTTRRALLSSAMALVLCLTMLMGTTFAWFTDTATVSVNTIQSGTLDLELVDENGNALDEALEFVKAAGAPTAEKVLWEPGATYYTEGFRIKNIGNLAFKFKVAVSNAGEGNVELLEVINFELVSKAADGSSSEYKVYDGAEGYVLPNDNKNALGDEVYYLRGTMDTTAGNDYQDLKLENVTIAVYATQYAHEYDSNGYTYDANADGTPDLPEYTNVSNDTELKDAMENAGANEVIVLNTGAYEVTENVTTDGTFEVPAGANVTLNLNGNSITTNASTNADEVKSNEPTVINHGNLTIENGTISNKNATAGNTNVAAVHNIDGTLTLNNCTIQNVSPTSRGNYAVVVEGGTVILNGCNVTGNRGGITVSGDGAIKMVGGTVSATVYYPLYIGGTGASTFDGVTFTKQDSNKGKAITYNIFADNAGTAVFTNCVFESKISNAVNLDINSVYTGFTFNDCTYSKVNGPNG